MKIFQNFRLERFLAVLIFTGYIFCLDSLAQTADQNDRRPIIIIPGITGSELVNKETDELVWFKPQRSKDDDIRLPISANLVRNRDKLVARDIIRGVQLTKFLPEVEIYSQLITALETKAGYKEGSWDKPAKDGDSATFYVFPYDWRRDNVENARALTQKIESLKRRLGKPTLKFNVIAHSMGGLITRYAAMYGSADLTSANPKPTWAGARHFDKIFLVGTPNEGSASSLNAMLNGFSYIGGGVNLPFIQDISRFDVFTLPSMYQLLPHEGTFRAFDENLKPMAVDLYDLKTWENLGWEIWQDDDFKKKFNLIEQDDARSFFQVALRRAKQFQRALAANTNDKLPVSFYLMGADCKETLAGAVIYKDKKDRWKTLFRADSFEKSTGEKVSGDDVRKALYTMGDGVVPQSSLKAQTVGNAKILPVTAEIYQCEGHGKLVSNPEIQDKLFALLFGASSVK